MAVAVYALSRLVNRLHRIYSFVGWQVAMLVAGAVFVFLLYSAGVTVAVFGPSERTSSSWSWTWSCTNGKCVRNDDPAETYADRLPLEVCKLTCGNKAALWPIPTGDLDLGKTVVPIDGSDINFDTTRVAGGPPASSFLAQATSLFLRNLRLEHGPVGADGGAQVDVTIVTTSPNTAFNYNTDESYALRINTADAKVMVRIQAGTVYGVRHALETLGQLITSHKSPEDGRRVLVIVSAADITDSPVYPHRGILVDTSRHFLSVESLLRTMDAMAASKLNVLHWHATDTQSVPVQFPRVPNITRYGAYSAEETYSPQDVRKIRDYANVRGIRILFELDAPAHAGNGWQWGGPAGLGDLAVCVNQQPWRNYCFQPPCGQLNPVNPKTYQVLGDLFRDIVDMFPSVDMIHMGGDEINYPCWNSSSEIVDWMQQHDLNRDASGFRSLWSLFQEKAKEEWDKASNRRDTPIVLWTSDLTEAEFIRSYLDKSRYIIEAWVSSDDILPRRLLSMGYKLIMATKDAWYFDHGYWGETPYHKWNVVYDNRILQDPGVLGGEGAMWGELVDDHCIDSRIWPRGAALAERLWSDPLEGSREAEPRLVEHRERLVRRGIQASNVVPQWCNQNGLCT